MSGASPIPLAPLRLEFDTRLFRLLAIQKAAYRFGDRCSAELEIVAEGRLAVRLIPRAGVTDLGALEGDFRTEVLDQELREAVGEETQRVRNLLLAQAFSATALIDRVGETAAYADDPLKISAAQAVTTARPERAAGP